MCADQASAPHTVRFISRYRSEILAEWQQLARAIPAATELPAVALADHIPDLLDQVAEIAEHFADDTTTPKRVETARRHALDRLGAGFDVSAVVHELSILRGCMLAVWDREHRGSDSDELRALNVAFDRAIAESVARYVEARDRTLSAIDAISTVSLEAESLMDLLARLLSVFMRTTESVQTCAILLRGDDDRMYMRAAVGLGLELEIGCAFARGQGFAGNVWEQGRPLELRAAFMDPSVESRAIRDNGVRALYGIPLVQGGTVIGVAHMGSLSANQFADEDKQLFASMCARATTGIHHHILRERLAESEARLRAAALDRERALGKLEALLAAAPVGIAFVDHDLRYVRINDTLAAMNGRPAGEHLGHRIADMLPPATAAQLEPLLREVLATGNPVMNLELRVADRTYLATYFPVRVGGATITGVGGVIVETTDIDRVQTALAFSEARLKSIIEHAPVAIYVKDQAGRIVLANERLAEALGVSRDGLLGRRAAEVVAAEFERDHRANDLEVMRSGQPIEAEETLPFDGGTRTYLTVKFPIPGDRGETFVCGISTEITDRKRMEDQLRTAIRTRNDVLAIVSHDLRNPLNAIQLSAATLRMSTSDAHGRKHLDMIQRSSSRMEHLIGDLLDAVVIERNGLQLELARRPCNALVYEAADLNEPAAAEREMKIRTECAADLEIACDRERLLQVFGNLVGNAIKFCRAGDSVTIGCALASSHVRFFVADTGPGIPAAAVPHLFEPYWSAPEHAKRGAGLGLYIARGIVEAHGGTIWVEPRDGGGTTFSFTIPIATA